MLGDLLDGLELQLDSALISRSIALLFNFGLAGLPSTRSAFIDDRLRTGIEIRRRNSLSLPLSLTVRECLVCICIATWEVFAFFRTRFRPLMLPSLSLIDDEDDGGGGACRDGTIVFGPRLI